MKRAGLRCGKMELGHLVPFKDFAQSNKQPLKDLKQRRDHGSRSSLQRWLWLPCGERTGEEMTVNICKQISSPSPWFKEEVMITLEKERSDQTGERYE